MGRSLPTPVLDIGLTTWTKCFWYHWGPAPFKMDFLCICSWLFSVDWYPASGDQGAAAIAKAESEVWSAGLAGLCQWTAWNSRNFKVHQNNKKKINKWKKITLQKCSIENSHNLLLYFDYSVFSVLVSLFTNGCFFFHSALQLLEKHGITKELRVVLTRTPTRSSASSSSLSTQVDFTLYTPFTQQTGSFSFWVRCLLWNGNLSNFSVSVISNVWFFSLPTRTSRWQKVN